MEKIETAVKLAVAVIAGLWAGLTGLTQALLILMAIDMATGFAKGYVTRTLSSEVTFRGVAKKVITLLLVGSAHVLEPYVGGVPLGSAAAGYYLAHEGLSILENAIAVGLPVPQSFRDALAKLDPEPKPPAIPQPEVIPHG